jgi:phospholipase C
MSPRQMPLLRLILASSAVFLLLANAVSSSAADSASAVKLCANTHTCAANTSSNSDLSSPSAAPVLIASLPNSGGTANSSNSTDSSPSKVSSSGLNVFNHIIFMAQENRSLDEYYGELRQYWAQNGYPDEDFDGLPQFNPKPGATPKNPSCDPKFPPPKECKVDDNSPEIKSFAFITQCTTNTYPDWNEAHADWDIDDPTGKRPAKLNGFVRSAADVARWLKFDDTAGERGIGHYEDNVLNYYYFMASNFATSDRWFHPVLARTPVNREYLIAATSQGDVYPIWSNSKDAQFLTATPIFEALQNAGISWKIYINPVGTSCSGPPYDPTCLLQSTEVRDFVWGQSIPANYPNNLGTIGIANSDWDNDVQNGTLPAVAEIEEATDAGLDEHPSVVQASKVQDGALYVSTIINQVMTSSSWPDSLFILTYDENGGAYDHVAPHKTVNPDGIKPKDLEPGDVCYNEDGPLCNFTYTGYRVPLLVVSPYTKKHYVSHTDADYTAILKLIEKRFGLPTLTKRDAAQMDMTEFFDFTNPPWMTPPTPPVQNTDAPCYLDQLP